MLQKEIVANVAGVETSNESWIFLSLFSSFAERNITTYSSKITQRGVEPFLSDWAYSTKLMLTKGGEYSFLEKTPRNYLIFSKLIEAYPNDIHVVLSRDLDKVYFSMKRHFSNGSLKSFHKFHNDLRFGPALLRKIKEHPDVVTVDYSDISNFVNSFAPRFGFERLKTRRLVHLKKEGLGDPRAITTDIIQIETKVENASLVEKIVLKFCYGISLRNASLNLGFLRNILDLWYLMRSFLIIYLKVDLLIKDGIRKGWHRD